MDFFYQIQYFYLINIQSVISHYTDLFYDLFYVTVEVYFFFIPYYYLWSGGI